MLDPSIFQFKESSLSLPGRLVLKIYQMVGVIRVENDANGEEGMLESTNCTLINLALKLGGPTHEKNLANRLLLFQVYCFLSVLYKIELMFILFRRFSVVRLPLLSDIL